MNDGSDNVKMPDAQSATPETGSTRGRFVKGQSGNPSGRPKLIRSVEEVQQLARQHTPLAIRTLARIADDPKASTSSRVAASEALLVRGWGRVPTTELEAGGGLIIQVLKFADQAPEMKVIEAVSDDTNKQ